MIRRAKPWRNPSQAELATKLPGKARYAVHCGDGNRITVTERATGIEVLGGIAGQTFGTCGDAWMLQFQHSPDTRFYGLGEHSGPLEKSGLRVKCWSTDLWGDFSMHEVCNGHPNPLYAPMPWLIVKRGATYAGILVNHPGAVFMDLASNFVWNPHNTEDRDRRSFYVEDRTTQKNDRGNIALHCFLPAGFSGHTEIVYAFDDGAGFGYRKGERTTARFVASVQGDEAVLRVAEYREGYQPLKVCVIAHGGAFKTLRVQQDGEARRLRLRAGRTRLTGERLRVRVSEAWSAGA